MYYAVVDCDNCYVSCERVFRPELNGRPVVVLSNNDGCVVARSEEAKQLGIKAGTPYYQLEQQFPRNKIAVFSSNYELYGDLTARVMSLISKVAPACFRYSIDECFVYFLDDDLPRLKQWGEQLHLNVRRQVGIPVSVGIAPTKTLAKMASHFAKRYKGYRHSCLIATPQQRAKALQLYPVDDVWGVGRRYGARLQQLGIATAYDLAAKSQAWLQLHFNNKVLLRTWQELQGVDCIPNETWAKKQSICTSRSFPKLITEIHELRTHVANYAARCAEKLRRQHTVASVVAVFLQTSPFRDDLQQHNGFAETHLLTPTSSTTTLLKAANEALTKAFRPGCHYKKAGVILMGITSDSAIQANFVDFDAQRFARLKHLDSVVDRVNKQYGSETLVIATQQYTRKGGQGKADVFANAMRHTFRSKNPTTRWADIIQLK